MPKFRKKPVVIEAIPVADVLKWARRSWYSLPDWLTVAYDAGKIVFAEDHVSIASLEGEMRGNYDDWIICGVKGELYPCKPDIFEATYDPVEAEA